MPVLSSFESIELSIKLTNYLKTLELSPHSNQVIILNVSEGVTYSSGTKTPESFSHWVIQVGRFYYYFIIEQDRTIKTMSEKSNKNIKQTTHTALIGITDYNDETIEAIGDTLISYFNSTDTILNNFQLFLDLFLRALCNDPKASFDVSDKTFFRVTKRIVDDTFYCSMI